MKNIKIKSKRDQKKENKIPAIDPHNQEWMISEHIHPPYLTLSDFSKTDFEKMGLIKARRKSGRGFYNQKWSSHNKPYIPVYAKMIIYCYQEPTRSVFCNQADIPEVIRRIHSDPKRRVIKYSWLGKTYQPDEIPFWFNQCK